MVSQAGVGAGPTDEKFTGASLELLALPHSPCVQRLLLAERLATRACLTVDFFPARLSADVRWQVKNEARRHRSLQDLLF